MWQPRQVCPTLVALSPLFQQKCAHHPIRTLCCCRCTLLLRCCWPLQVAANLPGGTFFSSKELILNRITAILAAYRKYCATSSSAVSDRHPVVAGTSHVGCTF